MRFSFSSVAFAALLIAGMVTSLPLVAAAQRQANKFPVVIVVRHAEVAPVTDTNDDPPLLVAGEARARELAQVLHDAGVNAIITSELRRTRDTAAPLASALRLRPQIIAVQDYPKHINALAAAVRRHQGGAVLVVGHSNTITDLIATLGGPKMPEICAARFDDLFTLFAVNGKVHFIHSRYGAPSSAPECR